METERERECVCVCAEWRDSNRHNRGRQTEDQIKPDKAILVINKCISNNIRERNSHTGWTREKRKRGRGREREREGEREDDNGRPSEHGWRRWDRVNQSGSIWRRRGGGERVESSDNRDRERVKKEVRIRERQEKKRRERDVRKRERERERERR